MDTTECLAKFKRGFEETLNSNEKFYNPIYNIIKGNHLIDDDHLKEAIKSYDVAINKCKNNFISGPAYFFKAYCLLKLDSEKNKKEGRELI